MMIRPRLTDIISEQAAPSQWRNEAFYEGAKGSDRSTSTVMYGDLREEEVSAVILPELERWALRAERWQDHDDRDVSVHVLSSRNSGAETFIRSEGLNALDPLAQISTNRSPLLGVDDTSPTFSYLKRSFTLVSCPKALQTRARKKPTRQRVRLWRNSHRGASKWTGKFVIGNSGRRGPGCGKGGSYRRRG